MLAIKAFLAIPHIDNIYSIKPLKKWLKIYSSTNNKIYNKIWNSDFYKPNDDVVRLTNINTKNQDQIFINLYEVVEEIVKYHQTENNYGIRMNAYRKAINSKDRLDNWYIKNEGIGLCCHDNFLDDYLSYSDKSKHLILKIETPNNNKVYIGQKHFKNTIEFLELISIFNAKQEAILKTQKPLPNKTYPIKLIKEQFIISCKECNPTLFYPYLKLDNVITTWVKEDFYDFFRSKVYCMKEKHSGKIRLEITKDTNNNEIDIYQFYDEKHKYSLLLLYIKVTKDKFTFVEISPF